MPCILIVDNEAYQRLLVQEILNEDTALTFVEAADGTRALEMARVHKPAVVILNIMLPSLDGFEVCRQLRADPDLAQIPIVLLGTVRSTQNELMGQGHRVTALIYKPFEEQELRTAVQNAILRTDNRLNRD